MDDQTPTTPDPDRTPPVVVPNPHSGKPVPKPLEGMRPEAAQNPDVRPEQDEPGGPLGGLLGASATQATESVPGVDAPTEALPGDADAALLEQMGVEQEGIESGQLLGLVLAVLFGIAALTIVLISLFYLPYRQQVGTQANDVTAYPELEQSRTDALAKLHQYARADSTYQMPIDQAMSVVAGRYRSAEGASPAGLPVTRQQWNTLSVNRGEGTTVQNPLGTQQQATVENQRLALESNGQAGSRAGVTAPVTPRQGTTDEEVGVDDRTGEPAPVVLGDVQHDE